MVRMAHNIRMIGHVSQQLVEPVASLVVDAVVGRSQCSKI